MVGRTDAASRTERGAHCRGGYRGCAAGSPDAAPASAPGRPTRGTLVPQSPESPGHPASSAGGRGSGALEYASVPREGYIDGPRPGRTRWEILQPIVHVANVWSHSASRCSITCGSRRSSRWPQDAHARVPPPPRVGSLLALVRRLGQVSRAVLDPDGTREPAAGGAGRASDGRTGARAVQLHEPLQRWPSSAWLAAPAPAIALNDWFVLALLAVWACGFVSIGVVRVRMWQRIRERCGPARRCSWRTSPFRRALTCVPPPACSSPVSSGGSRRCCSCRLASSSI